MSIHEIEIFVDKDGALNYSKAHGVHVRQGEGVRWVCNSHDYGIQFTNNASPFVDGVLSLSEIKGTPTGVCTAQGTGKGWAAFKYTVSVHIPGGAKPIVIDDPVIIVEDG